MTNKTGEVIEVSVGEILQKIYDSEIHLRLGWMWDGGVDFSFGTTSNDLWDSEFNKSKVEQTGDSDIRRAVLVIADEASNQYPDSGFSKWWEAKTGGLKRD